MSKRFTAIFAFSLVLASSVAQAGPVLTQINCSGKTSDGRPVTLSIAVAPAASSYPAPATAFLRVGTDAQETLNITLTVTSGQDVSTKTVYLFDADLDGTRAFGARTFDQRTGVGALKLAGALRVPMMSCKFTGGSL